MVWGLIVGLLIGLIGAILKFFFSGKAEAKPDWFNAEKFPASGVLSIDFLNQGAAVVQGLAGVEVDLVVLRQSGNVERIERHPNVQSAIASIQTGFRRMKEPDCRIWANTPFVLDVRRTHYSGRGSSEGRKLMGFQISPAK